MSYKLLTVPLSEDEQEILRRMASQQCRRPRDHARYILLNALGIPTTNKSAPDSKNSEGNAIRQDSHVAFATA